MAFVLQPISGGDPIPLQGKLVSVGRGEICTIRPDDSQIKDLHFALYPTASGWELQDHTKGNTFVNSNSIDSQISLNHGDVISVGNTAFQFVDDALPPLPFPTAIGTPMPPNAVAAFVNKETAAAALSGVVSPKHPSNTSGGIYFILESQPTIRQACFLPPGKSLIIGRNPETTQLTIDRERVSRQHCEVKNDNGILKISDLKSRNGTKVNDRTIKSLTTLTNKDVIQTGDINFELEIVDYSPDFLTEFGIVLNPEPPLETDPALQFTLINNKCAEGVSFRVRLKEGEIVSVGRKSDNSIVLIEKTVSKVAHCKITNTNGIVTLVDDSTYGTRINGVHVHHNEVDLNDSDTFKAGKDDSHTFRIKFINIASSGAETNLEPPAALGKFQLLEQLGTPSDKAPPPINPPKAQKPPTSKPWWKFW